MPDIKGDQPELLALVRTLSASVAQMESRMDKKLEDLEADVHKQFVEFRTVLQQLTSREAIHADAVLRNKVEIMWKVMVWAGAVKMLSTSVWLAPGFKESVVNVAVNNKWYVLRTIAYPSGTSRMVHMGLERRV